MGGNDAEVVLIGREAASGTRDGFESISGTKDECRYRQELTSTGDVITAVSQNPNAIGYASLASIKDTVKALSVAGVAPSEDTVKDGTYLIQRPFVLVTKDGTKLSPPPRRSSTTPPRVQARHHHRFRCGSRQRLSKRNGGGAVPFLNSVRW